MTQLHAQATDAAQTPQTTAQRVWPGLAAAAARAGWSAQTIAATASDLRAWAAFAGDAAALPVNPATFVGWLATQGAQGLAVSTLRRRASSIARAHAAAGHPSPHTPHSRAVLRGFDDLASEPAAPKRRPVTTELIRAAWAVLGPRDRALLVLGTSLQLTRDELSSMRWGHLARERGGWTLELRGSTVTILDRAAGAALDAHAAAVSTPVSRLLAGSLGPAVAVFGSGSTVNRAVKRAAAAAGEDPREYSAGSLSAAAANAANLLP